MFNLIIKYKPSKEYIILDVLSRQLRINLDSSLFSNIYSKLDLLCMATIVELN